MRERGVSTLGAVVLAGLAGMITAVFLMDWMVVDVKVPEPDSLHIRVPFPLIAANIATSFIPDEAIEEAEVPPELRQQRELVLTAVRSLAESPDATFVKVDADDAHVEVKKEGDNLLVAVDADDATVRCTVPIDGVLKALEDWDWETFDPGMVFDILSRADNGDLLRIDVDDGTQVAIKMW